MFINIDNANYSYKLNSFFIKSDSFKNILMNIKI